MIQITNVNYFMRIILSQFILFTVINAKYGSWGNATKDETLQKLGRARRAPFHRYIPPDTLTATIKDGNEEMHLTWKRAERYLVNKNVPVYTAHIYPWGPSHKKCNVMERVGNMRMYHDLEHKSAIIYFENLDRIYGIIGRSYQIFDLPIDRLSQPLQVDGNYVRKLPHRAHGKKKGPEVIENSVPNLATTSEQSNVSSLWTGRDITPEPIYIETLLFVTYDVVQHYYDKINTQFLIILIVNYLLHFNAVDMVFASLPRKDFEIYINLAGIIIEKDDGAFSRIVNYAPLTYGNNNILDIDYIFDEFERYPDYYDFPFARDSFDLILISTGRELQFGGKKPNSWHSDKVDLFAERQERRFLTVPMVIVRSLTTFSSYCIAAQEIGMFLGIDFPDPFHLGVIENGLQCYGIMQSSQHHCSECIKWRIESTNQLKKFLRKHRNRCWLLNKPRSLHLAGTILISQTPCRQCTCLGYYSYGMETGNKCPLYIPSDTCDSPLQCKYKDVENQLQLKSTIVPFDGTPCGERKVCWNGKCTSME